MIEKERLKELIEKQSVIYYLHKSNFGNLEFSVINKHKLTSARVKALGGFEKIAHDEDFFEHKEDAHFERKFGCIKRVQTISLPCYENLEKELIGKGLYGDFIIREIDSIEFLIYINSKDEAFCCFNNLKVPFTKDNYIRMCEMVAEFYKEKK